MKALIVSATEAEVKPARQALPHVEFLVTGIGMVNTAYKLGRHLASNQYDLVINAGICGCFDRAYPLGTVFNVSLETFADFGADDNGTFVDIFGLNLLDKDQVPFTDGLIINFSLQAAARQLPEVLGVTVNTVSGSQPQIDLLQKKYKPVTESMEGAAFAYVCELEKVQYLQLRAASNYVEPRNRASWQIGLAIENLNNYLIEFLK